MENMIAMIYGVKLLKLGAVFVSANVSANYMSQVYIEKVLVNQENPQPLTNFIWMYSFIDMMFTLFMLAVVYVISQLVKNDFSKVIEMLMYDISIGLFAIVCLGAIVANTMYNKKFFMYKDDGLRAIRGLKEIVTHYGILFAIMPIFYLFIKQT